MRYPSQPNGGWTPAAIIRSCIRWADSRTTAVANRGSIRPYLAYKAAAVAGRVGLSEDWSAWKAAKRLRRTPVTTANISQARAEMASLRFHGLGRQVRSKRSSKKEWGQAHSRTP